MFLKSLIRINLYMIVLKKSKLIFIIIMIIRNIKTIKKGQITSIYFICYGIIRFLIESLRQDSLMLFNLKAAQLVSIIMIVVGIILFILPYIKRLKKSS